MYGATLLALLSPCPSSLYHTSPLSLHSHSFSSSSLSSTSLLCPPPPSLPPSYPLSSLSVLGWEEGQREDNKGGSSWSSPFLLLLLLLLFPFRRSQCISSQGDGASHSTSDLTTHSDFTDYLHTPRQLREERQGEGTMDSDGHRDTEEWLPCHHSDQDDYLCHCKWGCDGHIATDHSKDGSATLYCSSFPDKAFERSVDHCRWCQISVVEQIATVNKVR